MLLAGGSALVVFLSGVFVNLLGKEVESRFGAFPVLLLRLASYRVPLSVREDLYEEWLAELSEALHGTDERPLTRLWLGLRFSFGLLKSADEVGRTLQVIRNQSVDAVSVAEPAPVPAAINLPALDSRNGELVVIKPTTYREAREIGQEYRDGNLVVLDLTQLEEQDARRLVDFSAGLCFAQRGTIERVENRVFLLTPGYRDFEEPLLSA